MTRIRPAAAFDEFDRLADRPDPSAALDWLDRWRAPLSAHRDPLVRARFLLRCGALRETRQPVPELLDDLIAAVQVFHALNQPRDLVQALARMACWYHRLRLMAPALASGELALMRPELPPADRLTLQITMVLHTAQERLLPEAWDMLAQAEASQPTAAQDRLQLAALRGLLHTGEAVRARGLPSMFTLDLAPGTQNSARAAAQLQAAADWLQRCRPEPGEALPGHVVRLLAIHAALRGDAGEAMRQFDVQAGRDRTDLARVLTAHHRGWCWRMLGDPAQALADQQRALALLPALSVSRLQAQVCLELALCAEALGDATAALGWWHAGQRAQAVKEQQARRALRRLADLLAQLGWPGRTRQRALVPGSPWLSRPPAAEGPVATAAAVVLPAPPAPAGVAGSAGVAGGTAGADAELLARACDQYLAHLPRRLPYTRLAQGLGVSLRTLQVVTQRQAHTSLGELLRRALMQRAFALLCRVDEPIAAVARQLGYADPGSLSRDVRRHFGCSPSQLRAGLAQPAGDAPAHGRPPVAPAARGRRQA